MAQWKTIPILVVAVLMICCGYIFAQTQTSPPPRAGGPTELDSRMEFAIDMMFREMDTNHDGKISKKEWMAFQEKEFGRINKSGDGFITRDELRAHMNEPMRHEQEQMRRRMTPQ